MRKSKTADSPKGCVSAKPVIESFGLFSQYCPVILATFKRAKRTASLAWLLLALSSFSVTQGSELANVSLYYEASKALSTNSMYRWAAAVQRTDSANGTTYASAVMIAPDVFITAGHVTPRDNSLTASLNEVVFGANYNTSTDRYAVDHTQRYPGYIFGNTSTIDLGVGWTTSFVSGFNTPTTFASASLGQSHTMVDYGNFGDPFIGEQLSIGDRMAGYATMENTPGSAYPASFYNSFGFSPNTAIYGPLNVKGLNFSSGSPWYSANGDLSGLAIAGTLSLNGAYTTVLDLTIPEVQNYLQPIIQDSWNRYYAGIAVPKILSLLREGADVRLVWQGKGGSNYVVQAASTLGGTNTFTDLATPLTLPGSGPVITNYLDAGALTNAPARFYRIRLN